ncbi:class I SAM-dependent methyltransferase [Spirosoma validum]|uniref:Class I SAM-dependent methyltransferase n=1 Tax=Spirosoma validum TaxID=2771355 RepID=A0A927B6D5_9BACT|nr:class I SAM-dependent methyltransferase [Spirosoma validum]MBD2756108.1 class I SAM-dependent methyltransferase [Spirosoma validum]
MNIRQLIPSFVKKVIKSLIPVSVIDQWEIITGQRDSMTPPTRLHFVGGGDFKNQGIAFLQRFKEIGKLKPTDNVLDIGSGVGRMALPLTSYLSPTSRYEGIEIVKDGVDWCNEHIADKHPNFHFQHLNLYNKRYNPTATLRSSELTFPFPPETFDFIFLTSVFTHMFEKDIARYLSEMYRVLKPNGRVYLTIFLLNPTSRQLIAEGKSSIIFLPFTSSSMVESHEAPENAIAFDEHVILDMLTKTGFTLDGPIHYGYWAGRGDFYDYQDTIIVTKPDSATEKN